MAHSRSVAETDMARAHHQPFSSFVVATAQESWFNDYGRAAFFTEAPEKTDQEIAASLASTAPQSTSASPQLSSLPNQSPQRAKSVSASPLKASGQVAPQSSLSNQSPQRAKSLSASPLKASGQVALATTGLGIQQADQSGACSPQRAPSTKQPALSSSPPTKHQSGKQSKVALPKWLDQDGDGQLTQEDLARRPEVETPDPYRAAAARARRVQQELRETQSFRHAAGSDGKINAAELQVILGLDTIEEAAEIIARLDADGDGDLDLNEASDLMSLRAKLDAAEGAESPTKSEAEQARAAARAAATMARKVQVDVQTFVEQLSPPRPAKSAAKVTPGAPPSGTAAPETAISRTEALSGQHVTKAVFRLRNMQGNMIWRIGKISTGEPPTIEGDPIAEYYVDKDMPEAEAVAKGFLPFKSTPMQETVYTG